MGLDLSHGCWHGAYSEFMRWRCEVAKAAGMPPLMMMEGFYKHSEITSDDASAAVKALGFAKENMWANELLSAFYFGSNFPIKWECLKPSPLHVLLSHSDCDGRIEPDDCAQIAQELEELLPSLPYGSGGGHIGDWREKTQAFIAGLRLAAQRGEAIEFM